jgi:exonuclease SbcD
MRMAISKMKFTEGRKNVLIAHQYVTDAERSDSEDNVGGLDNVDASVFEAFDYVALGHIHKPQNVLKDANGTVKARYSGTPLKYSLSEANHSKSITVVELGERTTLSEIPLTPLHDMREITGLYEEIVSPEFRRSQIAEGKKLDDYMYVTLKDEDDIPDAAAKLRGIFPNLMVLRYDNARTRSQKEFTPGESAEKKSPEELFGEFFKIMTNREMNEEETAFIESMIQKVFGGAR